MRFTGRVVIVTGAGSGIGQAAARRFYAEGAMVALAGRHKAKLQETAAEFVKDRCLVYPADVSVEKEVKALVAATVKQFGRLDVLVNNAGMATMGKVTDLTATQWRDLMATDLDAVFYACKAAMPHLIEFKGCIVNTSSVSGLGGDEGMGAYNAAKGGVTNLTRALAIDHGRDGVRVNAVCPTFTLTPMTADMQSDRAVYDQFVSRIPLGRPARPEDIAAAMSFLASDDARFVTGVNLPVDGGVSASNGQPIYYQTT